MGNWRTKIEMSPSFLIIYLFSFFSLIQFFRPKLCHCFKLNINHLTVFFFVLYFCIPCELDSVLFLRFAINFDRFIKQLWLFVCVFDSTKKNRWTAVTKMKNEDHSIHANRNKITIMLIHFTDIWLLFVLYYFFCRIKIYTKISINCYIFFIVCPMPTMPNEYCLYCSLDPIIVYRFANENVNVLLIEHQCYCIYDLWTTVDAQKKFKMTHTHTLSGNSDIYSNSLESRCARCLFVSLSILLCELNSFESTRIISIRFHRMKLHRSVNALFKLSSYVTLKALI